MPIKMDASVRSVRSAADDTDYIKRSIADLSDRHFFYNWDKVLLQSALVDDQLQNDNSANICKLRLFAVKYKK